MDTAEAEKHIRPFSARVSTDFLVRENSANADFINSHEFLASGRAALLRALKLSGAKRVFVPYYYCPRISALLSEFVKVEFFDDSPLAVSPMLDFSRIQSQDAVLVVDYFGIRDLTRWRSAYAKHPETIFIEDFSHAPFSENALCSVADFAFASLRKCMPFPDGAWLRARSIPAKKMFQTPACAMADFASTALEAFCADDFDSKTARALFFDAEGKLMFSKSVQRMSAYSFALLHRLDVRKIFAVRRRNVAAFSAALAESPHYALLNPPDGGGYAVLKFSDGRARDFYYAQLDRNGIYPSIHWGSMPKTTSPLARELCSTNMAIPLDWRHTEAQARGVARIINSSPYRG